jgi:hypothetical protein
MTKSSDLNDFVQAALKAGQSRESISAALQDAGWAEQEINRALGAWADSALGLPVPKPQPVASARDFFVYALTFGLLVFGAVHFVILVTQLIELLFDDRGFYDSLRWSFAAVVVSCPLFFWLSYRDWRASQIDAGLHRSVFRKWMITLAMLFSAIALFGSLLGAVYAFLSGDFTLQFLLNLGTVVTVAGLIFWYYRLDAQRGDAE